MCYRPVLIQSLLSNFFKTSVGVRNLAECIIFAFKLVTLVNPAVGLSDQRVTETTTKCKLSPPESGYRLENSTWCVHIQMICNNSCSQI